MVVANVLLFIFAYMLVQPNLIVNSFVNIFIILFVYFFLLVNNISNLYNKDDKEYVYSVLQVALNQNMPVFDNIKDGAVNEAVSKVSAEKGAQINELKAKLATAGIK